MSDHYVNFNLDQIPQNEMKQLKDVISEIKEGESIVITVDNNGDFQSDTIFDTLVLNNFEVSTKTSKFNSSLNIIGVKKIE